MLFAYLSTSCSLPNLFYFSAYLPQCHSTTSLIYLNVSTSLCFYLIFYLLTSMYSYLTASLQHLFPESACSYDITFPLPLPLSLYIFFASISFSRDTSCHVLLSRIFIPWCCVPLTSPRLEYSLSLLVYAPSLINNNNSNNNSRMTSIAKGKRRRKRKKVYSVERMIERTYREGGRGRRRGGR